MGVGTKGAPVSMTYKVGAERIRIKMISKAEKCGLIWRANGIVLGGV